LSFASGKNAPQQSVYSLGEPKEQRKKDYEELSHTSAYLYQTIDMQLVYSTPTSEKSQKMASLHAWADANYIVHVDSKSQFGI
jgi:hypothetical protein